MSQTLHRIIQPPESIDSDIASMARLAAAREHRTKAHEAVQQPTRRRHLVTAWALPSTWLLLLALTGLNLYRGGHLSARREAPDDPARLATGLQILAEMEAAEVEEYKSARGVLPERASDLVEPGDEPDFEYERVGDDGYRITIREGDSSAVFDSRRAADEAEKETP